MTLFTYLSQCLNTSESYFKLANFICCHPDFVTFNVYIFPFYHIVCLLSLRPPSRIHQALKTEALRAEHLLQLDGQGHRNHQQGSCLLPFFMLFLLHSSHVHSWPLPLRSFSFKKDLTLCVQSHPLTVTQGLALNLVSLTVLRSAMYRWWQTKLQAPQYITKVLSVNIVIVPSQIRPLLSSLSGKYQQAASGLHLCISNLYVSLVSICEQHNIIKTSAQDIFWLQDTFDFPLVRNV